MRAAKRTLPSSHHQGFPLASPPTRSLSFTTSGNGISSRLVNECQVSEAWDPGSSLPPPEPHAFQALWDTGATNSMISQDVVHQCGLAPTTLTNVQHAQGVTPNVPVYLVNIVLPNRVVIPGIEATLGKLPTSPLKIDVLIGMDIINKGDFAVTNLDGKTKFSFRMPSQAHIDFVMDDRSKDVLRAKGFTTPSPQKRQAGRRKRKRPS